MNSSKTNKQVINGIDNDIIRILKILQTFCAEIIKIYKEDNLSLNKYITDKNEIFNNDAIKKKRKIKEFKKLKSIRYICEIINTFEKCGIINFKNNTNTITYDSICSALEENGNYQYYVLPDSEINLVSLWNNCDYVAKRTITSRLNELYIVSDRVIDAIGGLTDIKFKKTIKIYDNTKSLDEYFEISSEIIEKHIARKGTKLNDLMNDIIYLVKNNLGKVIKGGSFDLNNMDAGVAIDVVKNLSDTVLEKMQNSGVSSDEFTQLYSRLEQSSKSQKEIQIAFDIFKMLKGSGKF